VGHDVIVGKGAADASSSILYFVKERS